MRTVLAIGELVIFSLAGLAMIIGAWASTPRRRMARRLRQERRAHGAINKTYASTHRAVDNTYAANRRRIDEAVGPRRVSQDWSLGGPQDWSLGRQHRRTVAVYGREPGSNGPSIRRPVIPAPPLPPSSARPSPSSYREAGAAAQTTTLVAPPPRSVYGAPGGSLRHLAAAPTKKKKKKKKKRPVPRSNGAYTSARVTPASMRFVQVRQDGDLIKAEGPDGSLYVLENGPHTFVVDDVTLPDAICSIQKAGFEPVYDRRPGFPDEWEVSFVIGREG